MSQVLIEVSTELDEKVDSGVAQPWVCILFNDDVHSFDEVIFQIIKATGYSFSKARNITIEAHTKGKAVVFSGDFEECLSVSNVLEEIQLRTQILS
jgi:ATP-dependent Clp protease adapter protein ClpS